MRLTDIQREVLTVLALGNGERPYPLYRSSLSGPCLSRPDFTWQSVPQAQVDRLVGAGYLSPVQADRRDLVAYWLITDAGRAALTLPAAAERRRRRKAGADG